MRATWLTLLGSVAYATARYNVFKGVPWSEWPTYTLNKALALAALFLLARAAFRVYLARTDTNAHALQMASVFASMHVMLSLVVLSPAHFEKWFVHDKLTAVPALSMLLGAIAAVLMMAGRRIRVGRDASGGLNTLAILAAASGLHAMLPGFAGWFAPAEWPGMLPPITLISFVLGLAAAVFALLPRRTG
jgi:hypothetical protein